MIDSLARPGGNVTGVFDLLSDLAGKRLELLKEIFPKLSRVSHFSTPGLDGQAHLKEVRTAARVLGVQVQPLTYVRDERPWEGEAPTAAWYQFSPDRKGARPVEHLANYTGC